MPRRADHAVLPRERHHLEDRRDAAALARRPSTRSAPWNSTSDARVAPVAELVLQPLDANRVACVPSGAKRGSRKHVKPALGLREHEEARRDIGAEKNHLWPTSS